MRQDHDSPPPNLARGVITIVAAGIVLGLTFNALGRASHPARGLAWVRVPETIARLEDVAEAVPGESAAAVAPDRAGVPEPGAPSSAAPAGSGAMGSAAPGAARAPSTQPSPRASATAGDHAAPASGSAAGAPGGAGDPASTASRQDEPSPPLAAAALPAIPVVDHPLQVELATLEKFYDARAAVIVDAREPVEYEEGHIPGALSIPFDQVFSNPSLLERLDPGGKPIIAYCSGPGCDLSMQLARAMIDAGFRRVLVFEAGFPAWQGAGRPVARGSAPGGG